MTKKYIFLFLITSVVFSIAASLSLTSFFQSSSAEAQSCVALPPTVSTRNVYCHSESHNGQGWRRSFCGVYLSNAFCSLNWVDFEDIDAGGEHARCRVEVGAGNQWQVASWSQDDSDAWCDALCLVW